MHSPVGELWLFATDEALHALVWAELGLEVHVALVRLTEDPQHKILSAALKQLEEYFEGRRREFDLPLSPVGTAFQKLAWSELSKIPYGETISYGEQARRLGDAKKSRAVGQANNKNPLPIVIPCHRVIAASGDLWGFGGGAANKKRLLDLERQQLALF